ncbi:MOSC domain-containing protein [Geodermatophilus sabuli]|uniref:MOSC domain-containing protein n=1 Tax=Geodermatophilus sabuli TaxID=1564158 RepID=A0A7K3W6Y1_9ACTN|nr:MOSC domain-containing protein [Geodermatophilus sabuli]
MRIAELWRYPVKSLQGEQVGAVEVEAQGLVGDRRWALFDVATGFGLTARRAPDLLFGAGRLRPDGQVEVVLPDGSVTADDAVLSAWLGRQVELRRAADEAPRYEIHEDDEEVAGSWRSFRGAGGAFHDSGRARVTLVSTGTLGDWDRRRFRANVVLAGAGEDALVGSRVQLGGVLLDVGMQVSRCVMVTRPQPGGVDRDTGVLRTIHRQREGTLAVGALVARPGTIAVGDELLEL